MKMRYIWKPLQQSVCLPPSETLIQEHMKLGLTREQALANFEKEERDTTIWCNDIYQVQRRLLTGNLVHLNIRRRDGGPILRDWRHFQWIKNQLIGEECEAVELYPAESRLVDTSNKFQLYGNLDPTWRFPIHMFDKRDVSYDDPGKTPGTRQRTL
jgi:hypothetical protein